jgi:uncharacterized membrane protein
MPKPYASARILPLLARGFIIFTTGLLLLAWLINTPPGLLGKADAIGYAVCHRIDLRSFHLGVRQLPLCARCSGMYLGAMLGLVYLAIFRPRRAGMPPLPVWIAFGFFTLAFGIDGVNSYLHLFPGLHGIYEPQNWLRLLTGTGMGLAISGLVYPAFNQTVWENWEPDPAISGLGDLAVMISLGLLVDMLVLSGNPLLLYPLALLSAAFVLVLLTMIYTMIGLMVFRLENRYLHWSQLIIPLMGGFGVALLQVALLDLVRFTFTGTWAGFHFG